MPKSVKPKAPKDSKPEVVEAPIEEEGPKDPRTIEITFGPLKDLRTVYNNPELNLTIQYLGETILETEKFYYAGSDQDNIAAVTLTIDLLKYTSVDNIISNPLVINLTEFPYSGTDEIIDLPAARDGKAKWRSEESILDLEEALLGTRSEPEKVVDIKKSSGSAKKSSSKTGEKRKDPGGKGSKTSKGSKTESSGKKSVQLESPPKPTGPQAAGTALLDFMPLFLGEETFYETLILKSETPLPLDDRTPPKARLPKILIQAKIDQPIPKGQLYDITVESIFNLPNVMSDNMTYKMVIHIPALTKLIIPFNDFKFANEPRKDFTNKRWYGTDKETNYYIEGNLEKVKSCFCARASDVMSEDVPRVDYNVLKRNYSCDEDVEILRWHLMTYRCVVAEILIEKSEAAKIVKEGGKGGKKSGEKDSKGSKKGKTVETATETESDTLHCMVYLDMCRLLYPGQTNVRIAAPLRTFNYEEAEATVGLKNSYFKPKPALDTLNVDQPTEKKSKEKKSKDTSKKGSSKSGTLSAKLPPPPAPPEPSKLIYNEMGMPTFVLVQFEFKEPLVKARELNDLREELNIILFDNDEVPELEKAIESSVITDKLYKDTLKTISLDLKHEFLKFQDLDDKSIDVLSSSKDFDESPSHKNQERSVKDSSYIKFDEPVSSFNEFHEKKLKDASFVKDKSFVSFHEMVKDPSVNIRKGKSMDFESKKKTTEKSVIIFLEYLKHNGVYQTYLATLTRAVAAHVNSLHDFDPQISSGDYQKFISNTYVILVEKMNSVINEMFKIGINPAQGLASRNENLLKYAYEAMELDLVNLANRYFLQRICDDETNPDFWFDYAIFYMHTNAKEKAFECVKQALKYKPNHKNSLVFYALILSEKKRFKEAETLLLSVTLNEPAWLEGWGTLYCIYFKKNNLEGMDICVEIARKNMEVHSPQRINDNAWSRSLIPNTFFYQTACYFISLRFFNDAQMMIANELSDSNEAANEYLLSVISYLKRDYDHAILHIDNSMQYGGCDFSKSTLRGNILANKGIHKCALEEYKKIFKLFEPPKGDYVYFVYIKSGLSYSYVGEDQNARVTFLHACKLNGGSPFTWLSAGILFYYQKDFLSAEDCLTQSNTLDNRLPETWAYLALVNVKLRKVHEANICLHQAAKHKLEFSELMELAQSEVEELNRQFESL